MQHCNFKLIKNRKGSGYLDQTTRTETTQLSMGNFFAIQEDRSPAKILNNERTICIHLYQGLSTIIRILQFTTSYYYKFSGGNLKI